jgi:hypothetical protein
MVRDGGLGRCRAGKEGGKEKRSAGLGLRWPVGCAAGLGWWSVRGFRG